MALEDKLTSTRLSLLLNSALAALKASTPLNARDARHAIKQATRALELEGDPVSEQMKRKLSDSDKAKALYRRAMGEVAVKEDDEAIKDLEAASKLASGDAAILKESVWGVKMVLLRAEMLSFLQAGCCQEAG